MTRRRYVRVRDPVSRMEFDCLSTDPRIGDRYQPVNRANWPDSSIPRPSKPVRRLGAQLKPKP